MIDYLEKICNIINKYADHKEVVEVIYDIQDVKNMINNGYNETKVNEIYIKYAIEIELLRKIEIAVYTTDPATNNSLEEQELYNLQYMLLKIAVWRILKLNNKQFQESKLVSRDYKDVYELIKNL